MKALYFLTSPWLLSLTQIARSLFGLFDVSPNFHLIPENSVRPQASPYVFVVDKVALEKVSSQLLWFSPPDSNSTIALGSLIINSFSTNAIYPLSVLHNLSNWQIRYKKHILTGPGLNRISILGMKAKHTIYRDSENNFHIRYKHSQLTLYIVPATLHINMLCARTTDNVVEEWKTNLMSLAILFHFLCAQHVSDINISIIRSLRLCC